jgi:hypothetical protein
MRLPKIIPFILLASIVMAGTACKTFVVKNVNYAHQIESVLTPDENGNIEDVRHGISFNIAPFQKKEFGENDSTQIKEVRLIRNTGGFYFITATHFKNVYVMEPGNGSLKLKNRIKVSEISMLEPAFNMRDGFVQLVKVDTNEIVNLNEEGIQKKDNDNKEEQS